MSSFESKSLPYHQLLSNVYCSDMSELFKPFHDLMRFHGEGRGAKYGQLILPDITRNFGPMYFSRIVRIR